MNNSLSDYQTTDSKPLHITFAVPRILKSDGVDYTYYQSVCSCGWSGDYKASKLTAQEDYCPNKEMGK